MVKRTFKAINPRALLEPQTTSNYDSRKENIRFYYESLLQWIGASIVCYHRTYVAT